MPVEHTIVGDDGSSDAAELRMLYAGVAGVPDAVIISRLPLDAAAGQLQIAFVNAAFERLTGWPSEDVLGQPLAMLDGLHPSLEEMLRARVAGPAPESSRVELLLHARDGRAFWAAVDVSPIIDDAGRHSHWISIYRDITHWRLLEEQLFHAQKMDAVGRLAGGVAHDFNNVLTAIGGFSELLLTDLEPGSSAYEEVQQIKSASDRASALTRQLLAFSRKQTLRPRHIDVNALSREMERLLRRIISANVNIRSVLAEPLPSVYADPMQFEQVLLNLVVNASQAMPDGGTLTIETGTVILTESYVARHPDVSAGPYVSLVVSDTGAGMDRATRERMFEPFFTTKSSGTGLGLSTVYRIVRQTGGHLWVYSEVGVGTTFKVYFPVSTETPDEPSPLPHTEVLGGHETILVVEDEPAVREVVRAMLERRGYTVLVAAHGDEAMQLSSQYAAPIDLLLTDVVLPRSNGRRVAELLSMDRPGLRVLYMSGYTEDAIASHGALVHGGALVEKPFTDLTLARRIRDRLDSDS